MKTGWHITWAYLGFASAIVAACSAADNDSGNALAPGDFANGGFPGAGGALGVPGAGNGGAPASAGGSTSLPPETETNATFELPHAGEHYVYVANPDSNTVAVIDATTLSIQTVEAGAKPRFLQTLAGNDAAIVLNVDSHDATIVRTTS